MMTIFFLGEFPALSRVFVQERDLFLAHALRVAVDSPVKFVPEQCTPHHITTNDPPVIVGVVGIGHVSGIVANWDKVNISIEPGYC
jgi:pheromone shutdown protein TraB